MASIFPKPDPKDEVRQKTARHGEGQGVRGVAINFATASGCAGHQVRSPAAG